MDIFDPLADSAEVKKEYALELKQPKDFLLQDYLAVVIAVAHNAFRTLDFSAKGDRVIYDLKGILPKEQVSARL